MVEEIDFLNFDEFQLGCDERVPAGQAIKKNCTPDNKIECIGYASTLKVKAGLELPAVDAPKSPVVAPPNALVVGAPKVVPAPNPPKVGFGAPNIVLIVRRILHRSFTRYAYKICSCEFPVENIRVSSTGKNPSVQYLNADRAVTNCANPSSSFLVKQTGKNWYDW